jgi:acyl-CoA thioesterase-1
MSLSAAATGASPGPHAWAGAHCRRYGVFALLFNVLAALLPLAAAPAAAEPAQIVALGDSLTAGYGLPAEESFTAQLQARLRQMGHDVVVHNAGVSGDTTAGGLARLDWALAGPVDLVLVELGANDGLRGIDPAETRRNLDAILAELGRRGHKVLLAGMLAPPNLGAEYGSEFNAIYPELSEKYAAPIYPFFLDGVAAQPRLNQADGIHPNAAGVALIAERIAPFVIRALQGE